MAVGLGMMQIAIPVFIAYQIDSPGLKATVNIVALVWILYSVYVGWTAKMTYDEALRRRLGRQGYHDRARRLANERWLRKNGVD